MSLPEGPGPRTVLDFLRRASDYLVSKGIPTPRLDAEVLLAHLLGARRLDLYLEHERPLSPGEVEAYRDLVKRRGSRVPVAYLTGEKEFFSLKFRVSPSVLIPRPETEVLVEEALAIAREREAGGEGILAADVGTGSGCIAVSLAKSVPSARVVATDRSGAALALARENAAMHGVSSRVGFLLADGLEPFRDASFDLVLSNPPYVDPSGKESLPPEVRDHEPAEALFAPPGDPLGVSRTIAREALRCLAPAGAFLLEIGAGTREAVEAMLRETGFGRIEFRRDLAGLDRLARSHAV